MPWKTNIKVDPKKSILEKDRKEFRKKGINTLIDLDGECFALPGGGFDLQGNSVLARWKMDQTLYIYEEYNNQFKKVIDEKKKNEIENNFNIINNELKLELVDIEKFILKDYNNKMIIKPIFDDKKNIIGVNITQDLS